MSRRLWCITVLFSMLPSFHYCYVLEYKGVIFHFSSWNSLTSQNKFQLTIFFFSEEICNWINYCSLIWVRNIRKSLSLELELSAVTLWQLFPGSLLWLAASRQYLWQTASLLQILGRESFCIIQFADVLSE